MIRVHVDVSDLVRALARLSDGLERAGPRTGMDAARESAQAIRRDVPVRSGRLRSTVDAVPIPDGGAVTYGGTLPYARYIERRSHAVAHELARSPDAFADAMTSAAEREVARI